MPPRRKPAWEQRLASRLQFERGAYAAYPSLQSTSTGHRQYARIVYRVVVPIDHYEPRTVEMHFRRNTALPSLTAVYADGPNESPHRYPPADEDHDPQQRWSLCIWHPKAIPDSRWVPDDGLLTLIELTRAHLFKEAYYRETGEWLGPEAPHTRTGGETC